MKKNIFTISLLGMAAVIFLTACSKDFLEVPIVGKLPDDQFYKTDADAIQATTAVYDMMQYEEFFSWYMLKTLPSDESNSSGASAEDQPALQTLDKFNFDSENQAIMMVWNKTYGIINRANLVINKVLPENDLRKRLIAEAKALRAYSYFELVTQWGKVPIVLDQLGISEFTTQTRAEVADVYAQIEKDLIEAIPDLPVKSVYGADDKFRLSKGAAQSILGKVYLYEEKWSDAAGMFNTVISSYEYALEPNFAKIFSSSGEFGQESILETSFTTQATPYPNGRARESNVVVQLMGIKAGIYQKAPGDSLVGGGWAFNVPKAKLYNAYIAAGDVIRRRETLMSQEELVAKGGNWTQPTYYDYEGFVRRKYGSYSTETFDGTSVADFGTNWRLIRYADVLLMLAEANYRLGDEENARLEMNKVRARASLGDVTATGDALFDAIVTERQLELAYEAARYPDLI
ncbi:MAG TPA: RagB/SusD family nutrient uptake outer membrane protein, partial [Flavitalea sp.]|nr:RagB/SusD family nutrient uptake outer membrane protein [Flavitalea sp.]